MGQSMFLEMTTLPPFSAERSAAELKVTLLIPTKGPAAGLEETLEAACDFMSRSYGDEFEIVVIATERDPADRTLASVRNGASRFPRVRCVAHEGVVGKGAALRTGFTAARGEWIFLIDADLPYDLEFFDRAAVALQDGFDYVTGNRRLPVSEFDVPVSLLRLAYRRHSLGLLFNRTARLFLPIDTTDTQAGIKAMSRRMAEAAFSRQICPGFLFDLEFFLTASKSGYRLHEMPVTLYLNSEKSTVRLFKEALLASWWMVKIARRHRLGAYGAPA